METYCERGVHVLDHTKIEDMDFSVWFNINPCEFEHEVSIEGHGRPFYVPNASISSDPKDDMLIDGIPWKKSPSYNVHTNNMTAQFGYHGPIMHQSEYIGRGIAARLFYAANDDPMWFCIIPVNDEDEVEQDYVGWTIISEK